MQANLGKENNLDEEKKSNVPKCSIKPKMKCREFGRELTNTNSTAAKDRKSRGVRSVKSKLSKASSKRPSIVAQFEKLTLKAPTPSLSGKDLQKLRGEELSQAIKEEMVLRRKKQRDEIPDYDMFRVRDAQEVAEYVGPIFEDMKESQKKFTIQQNYLERERAGLKITVKDRASLIDFVEELHAIFDLIPETLFISIQTIDRFLGLKKDQTRGLKDLQRVAVAAVLTVSKYEDIIPPSLDEMIKQMRRPCSREDILLLETQILRELDFDLTVPTSYRFLERFTRISPKYNSAMDYGEFVIELANYDFAIINELSQSQIAAVALYVGGIATSGVKKWTKPLEKATGASLDQIKEMCENYFVDLPSKVKDDMKGRNIFRKYQGYAESYPSLDE